jgi:AcrR family transcriptional regulator
MRNEILSVAKNLFHKQGLENTSIEEISECAGYNAGDVQRIYTSEYDLFFEVVTTDAAEFVAHLQNHVKSLPHISQQISTYLDKKNAYYLEVISPTKFPNLP